jgi:hypothetical protein
MATLILQCVVAVLTLVFGVAALRVGTELRGSPRLHHAAWVVTGVVFTILGISTAIQNCVAAPWAFFAGAGTPVYDTYIRFSPMGNHSRGLLIVAYGAMMVGLMVFCRGAKGRLVRLSVGVSFLAMALGAYIGWKEGPLVRATHYTAMAVSDSAELLFLMGALFVAVIWNTTDRLLWLALVIFTVHELLDVGWYSALAWAGIPGAWSPSPLYLHLYASVGYLLMTVIAVRRANLARRGVRVPGLLEPPAQATPSLLA